MKKLIIAVFLVLLLAGQALADQFDVYENQKLIKSVVFAIGMDEYYVNGQTPGTKMDAKAFIENDRTYVPVRYLAYALGLTENDVLWDQATKKVTLHGRATLEMKIRVPQIVSNGNNKTIDVAPLIKEQPAARTYLPARYVAEGLGYEVAWDAATRTVICWPKGTERPDVSTVQKYVIDQKYSPPLPRTDVVPGEYDPRYKDITGTGKRGADKIIDWDSIPSTN